MRPKKRILLIDSDEYRASLMNFRLRTHKYAVFAASSAAEAEQLFGDVFPDVIIAASSAPDLNDLLPRLHARNDCVPQMVIAAAQDQNHVGCDCFLVNPPAEELLQRLKVISARKRGPKKGPRRVEAEEIAAARRIA